MTIRFIALLVLGLFCIESGSQSLSDVTRTEAANQAIADLQQKLWRAGAPLGWVRP